MKTTNDLNAVRSVVRALMETERGRKWMKPRAAQQPVITISRQAGTDAASLAERLAEVLNESVRDQMPWIAYDRELVDRVVADHHLSRDLVASLDERDKSWFEHYTAGMTGEATGTDVAMKTARTIRALAWVGRAIIVGRGSQAVLSGMAHAVHIRLIAPQKWRTQRWAQMNEIDLHQAADQIREIDSERARFVRNHFNQDVGDPELYHLILNMSRVDCDRAARVIAKLASAA